MSWALTGDTGRFWADLRWPGWERAARTSPPGSLLAVCPPLCTAQGRTDLAATSRRAVPWREVVAVQEDLARQLADVPEGGASTLAVDPGRRA